MVLYTVGLPGTEGHIGAISIMAEISCAVTVIFFWFYLFFFFCRKVYCGSPWDRRSYWSYIMRKAIQMAEISCAVTAFFFWFYLFFFFCRKVKSPRYLQTSGWSSSVIEQLSLCDYQTGSNPK